MQGGAFVDKLSGGDGADTLIGGGGNDTLNGGNHNDALYGGAGSDTLLGGAGADKLVGGAGDDVMTGGAGADVFCFASGFGNDRITDFDANPSGGQDTIDLTLLGVTGSNFDQHVSIGIGAAGDVVVTIDGTQTIRLSGITDITSITKSDFALLGG
jgi:Ca2+-binding RTX toxin-like protein